MGRAVVDVCRLYDESAAAARRLAQQRAEIQERLVQAVTAIQAQMPTSPRELSEVLNGQGDEGAP